MKSAIAAVVFMCVLALGCAYAAVTQLPILHAAKIVDVKGNVTIQKTVNSIWENATVALFVDPPTAIKTGIDSKCTLTFDDTMKNILTVKEETHIVLMQTEPVNISLLNGRVMVLLRDSLDVGEFEILTPTAVCMVHGPGAIVSFEEDITSVQCVSGVIRVQTYDTTGAPQKALDLLAGKSVTVDPKGFSGIPVGISQVRLNAWDTFLSYIEYLQSFGNKDEFSDGNEANAKWRDSGTLYGGGGQGEGGGDGEKTSR